MSKKRALAIMSVSGDCSVCCEHDRALVVCRTCAERVCLACVHKRGSFPYAQCFHCDGEYATPAYVSSDHTLFNLLSPWPARDATSLFELQAVWTQDLHAAPSPSPARDMTHARSVATDMLRCGARDMTHARSVATGMLRCGARAFVLFGDHIVLGRAPCQTFASDNALLITIDGDCVDDRHVMLDHNYEMGNWSVSCLSTRGTWINGRRIPQRERISLRHRDTLQFGDAQGCVYCFTLYDDDEASDRARSAHAQQIIDRITVLRCPCGVNTSILDVDTTQCMCLTCARCTRSLCAVCGFVAFNTIQGHYHVESSHGSIYMTQKEFVALHRRRIVSACATFANLRDEFADRYMSDESVLSFLRALHAAFPSSGAYRRLTGTDGPVTQFAVTDLLPLLTPIQRALGAARFLTYQRSTTSLFNTDGAIASILLDAPNSISPYLDVVVYLRKSMEASASADQELQMYPVGDAVYSALDELARDTDALVPQTGKQLRALHMILNALLNHQHVAHAVDHHRRARLSAFEHMICIKMETLQPTSVQAIGLTAWDVLACVREPVAVYNIWQLMDKPAASKGASAAAAAKVASIIIQMITAPHIDAPAHMRDKLWNLVIDKNLTVDAVVFKQLLQHYKPPVHDTQQCTGALTAAQCRMLDLNHCEADVDQHELRFYHQL